MEEKTALSPEVVCFQMLDFGTSKSNCEGIEIKFKHFSRNDYQLLSAKIWDLCGQAVKQPSSGVSDQHSVGSSPGLNFMALLTAKFCSYDHDSPLTCKRQISVIPFGFNF